jgi:hypothetical protein
METLPPSPVIPVDAAGIVSEIRDEVVSVVENVSGLVIAEVNEKIVEAQEIVEKIDDQFVNALSVVDKVVPNSSCLPAWLWISSLLKRLRSVPSKPSVLSSTAPSQ